MTRNEAKQPKENGWQTVAMNALSLFAGVCCVLTALVLFLKTIAMPLFFDEYLHVHNLWLLSVGRIPHQDFWCNYPALGYVINLPWFRHLPESIYSVIAMRLAALSMIIVIAAALAWHARRVGVRWYWGVLPLSILLVTPQVSSLVAEFRTDAFAAALALPSLVLMFRQPTPTRCFLATSLGVLSVLIMPKYLFVLTFATLAYLGFGCLKLIPPPRWFASAVAGTLTGLLIAQALLWTSGTGLTEDAYWSALLMQKYFSHWIGTDTARPSEVHCFADFILGNPWVVIMVTLGLAGWIMAEYRLRDVGWWIGLAVLLGVAATWTLPPLTSRQYLVPGLFCLVTLMPYAAIRVSEQKARALAALALCLISAQTAIGFQYDAVEELAAGSGLSDFRAREELLKLIPPSERVVGLNRTHPTFRQDQTFLTYDERWGKPKGFASVLPTNSPVWARFQPAYLEKSLAESPPASLAFPHENYPPGWNEVLERFLAAHQDQYVRVQVSGSAKRTIFLRKDLLPVKSPPS